MLAVAIAAVLTVAVAVPANADDLIPPGAPSPVNVLPSTVRAVAPTSGTAYQSFMAQVMYSYGRNPEFWRAAQAVNAGTATGQQITLVQQRNGNFAVPATRTSTFLKGAAGAGTAITGYSLGTMIGSTTLSLIGYDAQGAVCSNTTGAAQVALSLLSGQDCTGFMSIPAEFVPNTDATQTGLASGLCGSYSTADGALGPVGGNSGPWPVFPEPEGCSAGNILWTANGQEYQTIGHVEFVRLSQIGTTNQAEVEYRVVYYGAQSGGWQQRSLMYVSCLSGPAGTPNSGINTTMGYWAVGGAQTPGTRVVTLTLGSYAGQYACPYGMVGYIDSIFPKDAPPGGVGSWVSDPRWVTKPGYTMPPAVPASGDPLRTLRCVVTHDGGQITTRDSATFRETDGVLPQLLCPDISGLVVESVKVLNVNIDEGTTTVLYEETTTPEYQTARELAPECASGTCMLDLRKEGVGSCFQSPESCLGWFADPNKSSKYSCQYGSYAVDLAECTVYAPTFQPGATTTGDTYGDPTSGEPITNPAPNPGNDPTGEGRQCFPSGWGVFNPIEWIFRPVGCALESAFVPSQARVDAALGTIRQTWEASTPGSVVNTIGTMEFVAPSGCDGITVDMSWLSVGGWSIGSFQFMQACPGDFFAGFASATKVIGYLAFTIAGVIGVTRQIGRIFGYGGVVSGSAD